MKGNWPHDIVRLLENWACWIVTGAGSADLSPFPAYNLALPGPRAGSVTPMLCGEAVDTDQVIIGLSMRYQQPLRMNYIWPNTADRANARRCNCCLNTYKVRLDDAHKLFAQGWYARPHRAGIAGSGVRLDHKRMFNAAA